MQVAKEKKATATVKKSGTPSVYRPFLSFFVLFRPTPFGAFWPTEALLTALLYHRQRFVVAIIVDADLGLFVKRQIDRLVRAAVLHGVAPHSFV